MAKTFRFGLLPDEKVHLAKKAWSYYPCLLLSGIFLNIQAKFRPTHPITSTRNCLTRHVWPKLSDLGYFLMKKFILLRKLCLIILAYPYLAFSSTFRPNFDQLT